MRDVINIVLASCENDVQFVVVIVANLMPME